MSRFERDATIVRPDTAKTLDLAGDRSCRRPLFDSNGGTGHGGTAEGLGRESKDLFKYVEFTSQFAAVIGNFEEATDRRTEPATGAWIRWHFQIRGETKLESANGIVRLIETSTMVHIPQGPKSLRWTYKAGTQASLVLLMRPKFVAAVLSSLDFVDSQWLVRNLMGSGNRLIEVPANAEILHRVRKVIEPPFNGRLCNAYWEGMVLEILHLSFREAEKYLKRKEAPVSLSRRDIDSLREVRAAIVKQPTTRLTISQLSRRFGINERKLKEGFKILFGDTVFHFAQEQRMQLARRLIEEDSIPICRVSSRIGYQTHTSFTAAFKRFFGYLPRDVRLRARATRNMRATTVLL